MGTKCLFWTFWRSTGRHNEGISGHDRLYRSTTMKGLVIDPTNETIYGTFLESTIQVGEGERKLIQKKYFGQYSLQKYSSLSVQAKGDEDNARAVLLSQPHDLSIREVKQVVYDVFRHCPNVLFRHQRYLSEFLLLADIRLVAIVIGLLGPKKISKHLDIISCIQTMHRSSSLYYYIPPSIKEEDEFVIKTLDCFESPLSLSEYCSILESKCMRKEFAIKCLRRNVAAYGHVCPELVDNFEILVELLCQGFSRKSCLITEESIFLDIIAFLKFTLEETHNRNHVHVLDVFKKKVKEQLTIQRSCHIICDYFQKADLVSCQEVSTIKVAIKQKLCLFLGTNASEGCQNKLELCWRVIMLVSM